MDDASKVDNSYQGYWDEWISLASASEIVLRKKVAGR